MAIQAPPVRASFAKVIMSPANPSPPGKGRSPKEPPDELNGEFKSYTKMAQVWTNIRVWMPELLNRVDKQRKVQFWARDLRDGLTWKILLPEHCAFCDRDEDLRAIRWKTSVRCFEQPIPIFVGTVVIFGILFVAGLFLGYMLLVLALLLAALGLGVLWIKSWEEQVRLSGYVCQGHAHEVADFRFGSDQDQLHVIFPTVELAEATNEVYKANRRKYAQQRDAERGETRDGPSEPRAASRPARDPDTDRDRPARDARPDDDRPARPAGPKKSRDDKGPVQPPSFKPREAPPKQDLPPLKLAGDDEDDV